MGGSCGHVDSEVVLKILSTWHPCKRFKARTRSRHDGAANWCLLMYDTYCWREVDVAKLKMTFLSARACISSRVACFL
jgi:hypothetical protein